MPKDSGFDDTDRTLAKFMGAFLPHISGKASEDAGCGLDRDDIIQEGLIGLFFAIKNYDASRGAAFSTYALSCIDNRIADAVRAAGRKKHSPLNSFLPIGEELELPDPSPEELAIVRDDYASLVSRMETDLSENERRALTLSAAGYNGREMAEKLGVSEKSAQNALARARRKLRSQN